jgi:hypothetical protein
MDVGMFIFEIDAAAVDYNLWHLGGRGVIEVYKWLSVYRLPQHGKIRADAVDVPPTGKPRRNSRIVN